MKQYQNRTSRRRQAGAITLLVGVILVLVASMLGAYSARAVNFGQKESNNRYWGTQAHEVAQGNIEQAIAWIQQRYSSGGNPNYWVSSSTANACPPMKYRKNGVLMDIANQPEWQCANLSAEAGFSQTGYTVNVRIARNLTDSSNVAWIYSAATNAGNKSEAVLEQKLWIPTFGSTPPGTAAGTNAPLIVNGCTDDITGGPDIYTCVDDPKTAENECTSTIAIRTLNLQGKTKANCLKLGHLKIRDDKGNVVDDTKVQDYLDVSPKNTNTCKKNAAWEELFGDPDNGGITKEQMKALSDAQAAAGLTNSTNPKRNVYWVDSSSNWHDSLGSESEPVVLVFSKTACASGCPKINGGPTIYGIVYLETECDKARSNGWGGATIYGTVAVESDMEKLNSNTTIRHFGKAGNGLPPAPPAELGVTSNNVGRVPGSWKDWSQIN